MKSIVLLDIKLTTNIKIPVLQPQQKPCDVSWTNDPFA